MIDTLIEYVSGQIWEKILDWYDTQSRVWNHASPLEYRSTDNVRVMRHRSRHGYERLHLSMVCRIRVSRMTHEPHPEASYVDVF